MLLRLVARSPMEEPGALGLVIHGRVGVEWRMKWEVVERWEERDRGKMLLAWWKLLSGKRLQKDME